MFKTRVALFWLATETKSVIPKQNMMLKAGNSQLDCKDFQKKIKTSITILPDSKGEQA